MTIPKDLRDKVLYPLILASIITLSGAFVSFKILEVKVEVVEKEQEKKVDKDVFELIREDISEIKEDIKEIKKRGAN